MGSQLATTWSHVRLPVRRTDASVRKENVASHSRYTLLGLVASDLFCKEYRTCIQHIIHRWILLSYHNFSDTGKQNYADLTLN